MKVRAPVHAGGLLDSENKKRNDGVRPEGDEVSYRSLNRSDDWWPAGLGRLATVGAQNDFRYAVFAETRRLVIDDRGTVSG
jgi:hypothetical protein